MAIYENFHSSKWAKLKNQEAKLKVLQELENDLAKEQGREPVEIKIPTREELEKL